MPIRLGRLAAFSLTALMSLSPAIAQDAPDAAVAGTLPFEKTVVAKGLEAPWELTLGPDGWLWVTERTGGTGMSGSRPRARLARVCR